jgi:hypothetical protein
MLEERPESNSPDWIERDLGLDFLVGLDERHDQRGIPRRSGKSWRHGEVCVWIWEND